MRTAGHSGIEPAALEQEFEATIDRLIAQEEFAQAEALARQMTQRLPAAGYGWRALAFLRLNDGDLPGAYEPMRRSMALQPTDTDFLSHWPTVRAAHEQSIQSAPLSGASQPAALPTRAQGEAVIALFDTGRLEEADAAAQALIEQFPAHPLGWKIRALSLYRLGQYRAAESYLQRAHERIPDDPDILQVYAAQLEAKGNHADAERLCRRLLEVAPGHVEGTRLLGVILMAAGRVGEAEPFLLQATRLAPASALAWNSLGSLYLRVGRLEEAAQQFLRSLDSEPRGADIWSNLLFCLTHSDSVEPDALFAAHRGFAQTFETPFKPHWPRHANAREPERTLRIGFVSADLRQHAVANFIGPILPHLARDAGLRLYAYSNTLAPDAVSLRLRNHFAEWRDVSELDDAAFIRLIEADGIDILIDLSGHTGYNRLPALARKPAPVQASWIGYPGTTGLSAIDYFFADRFWAPSEQFEAQFTEKIAYLPAVAPFQPEDDAPPLNGLPALRNGFVTFGSFNRINKLQRNVVALWAQLLRAVPTARLKIASMPADGGVDALLAGWFAEQGIARERLDFHPRTSVVEYLRLHHEVDIALDTFPFGGLTTALQSLWMGVPTLTLSGRTLPGRSGAAVMGHAGLECFVATDAEDFARRGAALSADLPALAELRASMRERCAASPMFQPEALAQGVSGALRTMWRRWCEERPPQSFDAPAESASQPATSPNSLKTAMKKRNFILCAPINLINHSNGVLAIAQLALSIEKAGHNASICVSGRSENGDIVWSVDFDTCVPATDSERDFVASVKEAQEKFGLKLLKDFSRQYIDECYVVYPEVILTNPLNAKRVIRYFLNKDGALTGAKVNVGPNDFILAHSRVMYPSAHFVCYFAATHPLFHGEGTRPAEQRTLDLLYVGKGKNYGFNGTIPNTLTITRHWPATKEQLAILLRNCRIFYTADACSSTNQEALLCGAVPAFIHNGPWSDAEIDGYELGAFPRLRNAASSDEVDFAEFEIERKRYVDQIRTFQAGWDGRITQLIDKIQAHFGRQ